MNTTPASVAFVRAMNRYWIDTQHLTTPQRVAESVFLLLLPSNLVMVHQ